MRLGIGIGTRRAQIVGSVVAPPAISALSSSTGERWSGAKSVDVTGSGFTLAAQAKADGANVTTVYNSPTSLTITLPKTLLWSAGARSITVDDVGGTSGAATYTVTNRADHYATHDGANVALNGATAVQVMTCWEGSLGAVGNLVQLTAANQPALDLTTMNGRPSVKFDGAGDRLVSGAAALTDFTAIIAFRPVSFPATGTLLSVDVETQARFALNGSGTPTMSDATTGTTGFGIATLNASNVYVIKRAGSTAEITLNRGTVRSGSFIVAPDILILGAVTTGSLGTTAYIGKVYVLSSSISAGLTTEILDSLTAEFGTP